MFTITEILKYLGSIVFGSALFFLINWILRKLKSKKPKKPKPSRFRQLPKQSDYVKPRYRVEEVDFERYSILMDCICGYAVYGLNTPLIPRSYNNRYFICYEIKD